MNNIIDISKSENVYIHFNSKEECKLFMNKYDEQLGNICCSGKGVCIKTYKNKKVTYDQLKDIKIEFKV